MQRRNPLLALATDMPRLDSAACAGRDPELWFADNHEGIRGKTQRANANTHVELAKQICSECPVLQQCADYVASHPQDTRYGIWAGQTAAERGMPDQNGRRRP